MPTGPSPPRPEDILDSFAVLASELGTMEPMGTSPISEAFPSDGLGGTACGVYPAGQDGLPAANGNGAVGTHPGVMQTWTGPSPTNHPIVSGNAALNQNGTHVGNEPSAGPIPTRPLQPTLTSTWPATTAANGDPRGGVGTRRPPLPAAAAADARANSGPHPQVGAPAGTRPPGISPTSAAKAGRHSSLPTNGSGNQNGAGETEASGPFQSGLDGYLEGHQQPLQKVQSQLLDSCKPSVDWHGGSEDGLEVDSDWAAALVEVNAVPAEDAPSY